MINSCLEGILACYDFNYIMDVLNDAGSGSDFLNLEWEILSFFQRIVGQGNKMFKFLQSGIDQ